MRYDWVVITAMFNKIEMATLLTGSIPFLCQHVLRKKLYLKKKNILMPT